MYKCPHLAIFTESKVQSILHSLVWFSVLNFYKWVILSLVGGGMVVNSWNEMLHWWKGALHRKAVKRLGKKSKPTEPLPVYSIYRIQGLTQNRFNQAENIKDVGKKNLRSIASIHGSFTVPPCTQSSLHTGVNIRICTNSFFRWNLEFSPPFLMCFIT